MANPERPGGSNNIDPIVHMLSLYLADRIKREDLSDNNRFVLDYYLEVMTEDQNFADQVNLRKNQLLEKGIKTPLYTKEDLKNARRHRRKRVSIEPGIQPKLWEDPQLEKENQFGMERVIDPMGKFYGEVGKIEKRHFGFENTILDQETKKKRMELRDTIGLPVARGKNPNVNDGFYKYLVRYVYVYDIFGIFGEYDRVSGEIPESLNEKITRVKDMLNEVLDRSLNVGARHKIFYKFVRDHKEEWNIM